jgi:hypothetical protein
METLHDKTHIHTNKKHIKVDKKNNNNTERPTPIKIYFPSISLNKINDIINLNPDKRIGNKSDKSDKSNKVDISKYLVDESSKIIIYSSTGIFEMLNNNLFQLYPIDKYIKEVVINNNLKLLLDGSYMKRFETPSYQIPYHHNIKYKTIKTYKNDTNSNIKFIIEMENETICDFYVLITSAEITNNENKKTELNKFVKDEVLSFLSRLNLYR